MAQDDRTPGPARNRSRWFRPVASAALVVTVVGLAGVIGARWDGAGPRDLAGTAQVGSASPTDPAAPAPVVPGQPSAVPTGPLPAAPKTVAAPTSTVRSTPRKHAPTITRHPDGSTRTASPVDPELPTVKAEPEPPDNPSPKPTRTAAPSGIEVAGPTVSGSYPAVFERWRDTAGPVSEAGRYRCAGRTNYADRAAVIEAVRVTGDFELVDPPQDVTGQQSGCDPGDALPTCRTGTRMRPAADFAQGAATYSCRLGVRMKGADQIRNHTGRLIFRLSATCTDDGGDLCATVTRLHPSPESPVIVRWTSRVNLTACQATGVDFEGAGFPRERCAERSPTP